MRNSCGNYPVALRDDMKIYDNLPRKIRRALQTRVFLYACPVVLEQLRMHRRAQPVVEWLLRMDQYFLARGDFSTTAVYGPEHPDAAQANPARAFLESGKNKPMPDHRRNRSSHNGKAQANT